MKINKDAYNKICDYWNNFRNNTKINNCIVDFVKYLKPNSKILDIGCGTGYPIDYYLVTEGFKVTGIDISENMINKAKQMNLANASFINIDILKYHTANKYDGIIAFDSLWHIQYDKQNKIYQIISNLLNKGGYLLFTHGKEDGIIKGEMFDETFYYSALDVEVVHQLLMENGFDIISSIQNYEEPTTGSRDLLIIAKKIK